MDMDEIDDHGVDDRLLDLEDLAVQLAASAAVDGSEACREVVAGLAEVLTTAVNYAGSNVPARPGMVAALRHHVQQLGVLTRRWEAEDRKLQRRRKKPG